jgi:hypothetical protein
MAPVYREVTLEWNGKSYTLTPTYRLIQQIEQHVSLAWLLNCTIEHRPPLSQLAEVLATCLQAAGCRDCDATAEEINAELYAMDDPAAAKALMLSATNLVFALVPEKPFRGNAPPPAEGGFQSSGGPSITRSPSDTSGSNQQNSGG